MAKNDLLIIQDIATESGDVEFVERRIPLQRGSIISADAQGVPKAVTPGPSGYILVSSEDGEAGVKWSINESAIHVSIWADAETTFVNGQGRVNLTAIVYKGSEEVTHKIAPNMFSWIRRSSNPDTDTIWTAQHKSFGNEVTITPDDVTRSALFSVEVLIDQTIYDN